MERAVYAGREAGGGDDLAVVHEALVGDDPRLRRDALQVVDKPGGGRRLKPVEQAGLAQKESAVADGHDVARLLRVLPNPVDDLLIFELWPDAAARNDDDVRLGLVVEGVVRDDAHAHVRRDGV